MNKIGGCYWDVFFNGFIFGWVKYFGGIDVWWERGLKWWFRKGFIFVLFLCYNFGRDYNDYKNGRYI